MSITSCPRCAQHVTLPVGVSDHVQVRCPLCHEQYTLADAIANSPPLLVIIDEQPADVPADWLAAAASPAEPQPASAEHVPDFADEILAEPTASTPAGEPAAEVSSSSGKEIEHDDFVMQEKDTEVEDFNFAPEPAAHEMPVESEPLDLTSHDEESIFNLSEPTPSALHPAAEETEIDFGEPEQSIDFGKPEASVEPAANEDLSLDFGEPQISATASEEPAFDFDLESPPQAAAADDDLVPDFGEPAVEPTLPVAAAAKDEAKGKKKDKKEKKSKEKKKNAADAKAGNKPPRKRSLVGTLASILLPLFITVPLALYGLLWLGPDYDFFAVGKKLPAMMVPAAFNKPDQAAQIAKTQAALSGLAQSVASGQIPLPKGINLPGSAPVADDEPAAQPAGINPPATEPADKAPSTDAVADTPVAPVAPPAEDVAAAETQQPAVSPAETETPATSTPSGPALSSKEPEAKDDEMPVAADEKVAEATEKPDDASADLDSLLSDDKPEAKPAETPEDKPVEIVEALGPVNAPEFTPLDLTTAMHDVVTANEKMTAAQAAKDDAGLKKARKDFYVNLFGLGQVATFVKDDAAQPKLDAQRRALAHLAANLAADPKRLEALKTNAARWFAFSKRTTPGIILAGAVEDVESAGKLYHAKIRVGESADAPTVTVVSPHDPQLDAGDQVVAIGSIFVHPEQELAGYDGIDTAVVWSGMTIKLPAEAK